MSAAVDLSYSQSTLHNAAGAGLTSSWRSRALADATDPYTRSARERDAQLRQTLDRLGRTRDAGGDPAKVARLAQVAERLTKGLEQDRALQIRAQQQQLQAEIERRRERARSDQLQAQVMGRLEAQFAQLGRELTQLNKREREGFRASRSFGAAGAVADRFGYGDVFKAITTERSKMVKELGTSSRMMALARAAADRKGFAGVFDAVFRRAEASAEAAADGAVKVARKAAKAAEEIKDAVGHGDGLGAGTFKATVVDFDGSVKVFTQAVRAMHTPSGQERYAAAVRDRQSRHADRNGRLRGGAQLRVIEGGLGAGGPGRKPGFMSSVVAQAATNVLTDVLGNALGYAGAAAGGAGALGAAKGAARGLGRAGSALAHGGGRWGRFLRLGAGVAAGASAAALGGNVIPFTPSTPANPGGGSVPDGTKAGAVAREVTGDAASMAKGGKGPRVRIASSAARVAGKALKAVLGPAALALEVLDGWSQLQDLYGMYKSGEITEDEYKQEFGAVVGSMLGGAAGAAALAKLGAIAGGVTAGPIGAAVGAVAGGVAGGVLGSSYGADVGRWAAQQTLGGAGSVGGSAGGSSGSGGAPGGATTPSTRYDAPDSATGPAGRAGTTTDYSSHLGKAGVGGAGERADRMRGVYDAFRTAGFPHAAAKSFAAEIGRENDYNPNLLFGSHIDPANGARNGGMMSWQGSRSTALFKKLGEQGLLNPDGSIQRSQAALNAMAQHAKDEMLDPSVLRNGKRAYDTLMRPGSSHAERALTLGDDVIKWRQHDPRYAHHATKRDLYYDSLGKMTDGSPAAGDRAFTPSVQQGKGAGGFADVPERIADLKRRGLINGEQCVALAKAYVGSTGSVRDWRRGEGAEEGTLKPGTPVGTMLNRDGSQSDRYAGGGTGTPGAGLDHAGVFHSYITDRNGKKIGMRMAEQYTGSGGPRMKSYMFGQGRGEHNGSNYVALKDRNGYLGGANNPMTPREDPRPDPGAMARAVGALEKVGGVINRAVGITPAEGAELAPPSRMGSMTPRADMLLNLPKTIDGSSAAGRRIIADVDRMRQRRAEADELVFGNATGRPEGFSKSWQGLPADRFTGGLGRNPLSTFGSPNSMGWNGVPGFGSYPGGGLGFGRNGPVSSDAFRSQYGGAMPRFRMSDGEMGYTGPRSDLMPRFSRGEFGMGPALTKRLMDAEPTMRKFNDQYGAGMSTSGFDRTPSFVKVGSGEGWNGGMGALAPGSGMGPNGFSLSGPSAQSGAVRQEVAQAQAKVAEKEAPPPPPPPPPPPAPSPAKADGDHRDPKRKLKKDEYSALLGVMNATMFNKGVA